MSKNRANESKNLFNPLHNKIATKNFVLILKLTEKNNPGKNINVSQI